MRRPLPTLPRGPRRRRGTAPATTHGSRTHRTHLLTCPRVSPQWEFDALRVLMKPHDWTRGAVEHRSGEQTWPADAEVIARGAVAAVVARLPADPPPQIHLPQGGDFRCVIEVTEQPGGEALVRALAVVLSMRLSGLWFTADSLYVRDGQFFRKHRDGTYKLRLVPATSIHLARGPGRDS